MFKTLTEFDQSEIDFYKHKSETVTFKSEFKFLSCHNGLRPGFLHIVMGATHGGKSTLIRSMLRDLCLTGLTFGTILVWLSEETTEEFKMALAHMNLSFNSNEIVIMSELEMDDHQLDMFYIREHILDLRPDLVFLDNITTSHFYMDQNTETQSSFAKQFLKKAAESMGIPWIVVAHTRAEVTDNMDRLIHENDIRGCKSIINLTPFLYIMQRFSIGNHYYSTVTVKKYRGQHPNYKMFLLCFDANTRSYSTDKAMEFGELKEAFKKRNKL